MTYLTSCKTISIMRLLNKKTIYFSIIICLLCTSLVAQISKKNDWKNNLEIYKKGRIVDNKN
ncbi:hypothetical protein GCM10023330_11660 [Litoribaculum gwangyangense]|uniref:Uncharacterized protein n=1 Tax=Litoribaculum gwangyangense TaxID=1130722 RepID=A0ABP9C8W5_9FLAO